MNIFKRKIEIYDYLIIGVILIFNILCYLLFWFGPWSWPVISPWKMNLYISTVFIFIIIGYKAGIKRERKLLKTGLKNNGTENYVMILFNIITLVELIFIPLNLVARTGTIFNLNQLLHPGETYNNIESLRQGVTSLFVLMEYLRIFFSPFLVAFLPLGIFIWKQLSTPRKILFTVQCLGILLIDLQKGTNKGLVDIVIYLIIMGFASYVYHCRKNNIKFFDSNFTIRKKIFKLLKRMFIIGIVLVLCILSFFQLAMKGRGLLTSLAGTATMDVNHWSISYIKDMDTRIAIGMFFSYLAQGYYGLDLSLNKPFEWTYGFGHSLSIMQKAAQDFDDSNIITNSYVYRCGLENNWFMGAKWHSFYPWVASDITFIGVIFLLFIVSIIYGRCWIKITEKLDISSVIVFGQFTILFFYLSMNNQIGQSFESFFGSSFWIIFWVIKNLNYEKIKKI